ncbi:transposase, MuDR, MULE transposase domain protein [Tanacetum coccineum]
MLHEMVMRKFKLEANAVINLSFKLSSFDFAIDITDDDEVQFFVGSNEYNTDDVVNENPQNEIHKWQKFMSFEPDIPEAPVYKAKPIISKQYSQQSEVEKGNIFDNKESLILAVRLKALSEGFQYLTDRSDPERCYLKCYNFAECDWYLRATLWDNTKKFYITYLNDVHTCSKTQTYPNHRNANKKVIGHLLTPKLQDRSRVLRGKDIQQDILSEYKIHISYQQAMKGKHYGTVTRIKTDDNGVFEMLFIAIGASIRTFLNYLRPVLMIDAAHLKGLYKGTNLVAVAMDGNNQIVPIAFGICKGETGMFLIALAVEKEFPLAFHVHEHTTEWFRPDAHEQAFQIVGAVNACSVIYRKEPVLKLAETYRAMVQECKYDVRNNRLGSKQSGKKKMKSATWVVKGVNAYQYEVSDGQYIREVNFQTGICGCRKWQLSGLPCGHVIAITRYLGLTDCLNYVADWFKKPKYQGTYSESIHSLGNMQQWEFPENIQKAIPPRMDNPQPGRPKNTKRIQSQGEEPRIIRCTRCTQTGHRRDQCGQPFVVQPPVNIRPHNDQQFTQNNQPSFNNPTQQFDNTFNNINHYTSQQYANTTYPSQPYCQTPYPSQPYDQHFANTSQPYTGHYTKSSQMYEQYNSQEYDAQHLDDINTNGSNSLVPFEDAIQERDTILMYTHHNRLHVYVSRVELSPLVVAELFRDETNKRENQGKPSCAKKLFV